MARSYKRTPMNKKNKHSSAEYKKYVRKAVRNKEKIAVKKGDFYFVVDKREVMDKRDIRGMVDREPTYKNQTK